MSEDGLHVSNVAGFFEHSDCGCAAQIVRNDAAIDALRFVKAAEFGTQRLDSAVLWWAAVMALGVTKPQLPDVGSAGGVIAGFENRVDGVCDGKCQALLILGGEAECACLGIVVVW